MSKYYTAIGKEVESQKTAKASEINTINTAIDAGFEKVETDISYLGDGGEYWAIFAEAWASAAKGDEPDQANNPGVYSSMAYALECKGWTTDTGGTTTQADGVTVIPKSAREYQEEASNAAQISQTNANATIGDREQTGQDVASCEGFSLSASNAALAADTYQDQAYKWANNPEDVAVTTDPNEYSAYHWSRKASEAAGDAVRYIIGTSQEILVDSTDPVSPVISIDTNHFTGKTANAGAAEIPVGTESQRPVVPAEGHLRFNDTAGNFEGYNGTEWVTIGVPQEIPDGYNHIINGGMSINQRAASPYQTTGYTIDRWRLGSHLHAVEVENITYESSWTDAEYKGTRYYLNTEINSIVSSDTDSLVKIEQRLEGLIKYTGKDMVLSFWMRSFGARPFTIELMFSYGGATPVQATGMFVQKITPVDQAWNFYEIPISVPSATGNTLGAGDYLSINFWYSAGSDYDARTGTLGTWEGGVYSLTAVKFENGTVATPFVDRNEGEELALCQRYYQTGGIIQFSGYIEDGERYYATAYYPVTMRTTPSRTLTASGNINFNPVPGDDETLFITKSLIREERTSNVSSGVEIATGIVIANGFFQSVYTVDAEL